MSLILTVEPGKFPFGQVLMTPSIEEHFTGPQISALLALHGGGDWGTVCQEDWASNDASLKSGGRILSAYAIPNKQGKEARVWVITEHDRSVTTVLLPEEY